MTILPLLPSAAKEKRKNETSGYTVPVQRFLEETAQDKGQTP